jgi:D-beta-D-heptose 7-phosphate kinase/D-beta-D-heptose 1-phosphate adenosyltransferase
MKIVLITGGFDPVHSGHISYIQSAKKLGDQLVVGVNSDAWLTRKKGRPFMPLQERLSVLQNIKGVDWTVQFNDDDGTAKDAIRKVRLNYPSNKIIFANGGDRTNDNIPEMDTDDTNIEFVFGVGGEDKKNSSSWILEEWKSPKTIRPWGYYRVLHTVGKNVKVKELTVDPGKTLSMQRHKYRAELWFVAEGIAGNNWEFGGGSIKPYKTEVINPNEWHQLHNPTNQPLKVIEIQYGEQCEEEDIERK